MKNFWFLLQIILFPLQDSFAQENHSKSKKTIYVVTQGWHTGLIVPSDCLTDSLWPEEYSYSHFEKLLIGWGDTDY